MERFMDDLIEKLEEILRPYLSKDEQTSLDLSDDDCIYRKFYFDKLSKDDAKKALLLYPHGEKLYSKYLEILEGFKNNQSISDSVLCDLVGKHLSAIVTIMQKDEDKEAINFILSIKEIKASDSLESFPMGKNILHKYVYGTISEFLLNELPDDDALWLLYDWSLEKSKWLTVSGYFLEDFIDKTNLFKAGFELWLSRNNNHFWIEGNSFKNSSVLCKAWS